MKNLLAYFISALFIFSAFSCSEDETLTPELSAVNESAQERVFIDPGADDVDLGDTIQFTAETSDNNSSASLFWFSTNLNVGTVDQSGLFTATGVGETEVTVLYFTDGTSVRSIASITVVDPSTTQSSYNRGTGLITGNPGDEVEVSLRFDPVESTQTSANISVSSSINETLGSSILVINTEEERAFNNRNETIAFDMPANGQAFLSGRMSSEFGYLGSVSITIRIEGVNITIPSITFNEQVGNHTSSSEGRIFLH